jgi:hypothetical protein
MESTRQSKRKHTTYYFDVLDRTTGALLGRSVDITLEGIQIISNAGFEAGRLQSFKLVVPHGFAGGVGAIAFDARSLWNRPDLNPENILTGFHFEKLSVADAERIKRLIDEYSFKD